MVLSSSVGALSNQGKHGRLLVKRWGQQRDKAGSSLRGLCIEVKVFLMNIFWVGDILLGTVTLFPSQIMVMK